MRGITALLLALLQETPLLAVDVRKGRTSKIDAPSSGADAELDAALSSAIGAGERSFSTAALETTEKKLLDAERRERPRATPELIIFLYPGRVSADRLRTLSEVNVDLELVIDPCERSVCQEAVAKHIEMAGHAIGAPVESTARYKLVWKTLILKTVTPMHDAEMAEYRVPIPEAIAAAARRGGGAAWLAARSHAETDYESVTARAIVQAAQRRRLTLSGPPSVSRSAGEADVTLRVGADRNRWQQHVLDAMAAAETGLRSNPATPPRQEIEVDAGGRHFRAQGSGVGEWLDGNLPADRFFATYVIEVKNQKGAQVLAFDDGEAKGGVAESTADDAEAVNALATQFAPLGACARAEAGRNRHFAGVTLLVRWLPGGQAQSAGPKEAALRGGELARCLGSALGGIHLPRFSGPPRTIEFPIRVKASH